MSLLKNGISIRKRPLLANILLFTFFFTLYFVFSTFIPDHIVSSSESRIIVQASFSFVIAVTLIVCSQLVSWARKVSALYTSSIVIILANLLLLVTNDIVIKIALLFVIGVFFSLGLLSFLTYFWKTTLPEERGRISGLIGLIAFPFDFVVTYLLAPSFDFNGTIALSVIITSGILLVSLLNRKPSSLVAKRTESGNYPEKRTIILYSIPWVIFSIVNVTLAKNASILVSQQVSSSFYFFLLEIQFVAVVVGSFIGGIVADLLGRRTALFLSLTTYGISAALDGLFTSTEMRAISYTINGLSWGILFTLYIFIIWSDLANEGNCRKMFSIGFATYYLSIGFGLLIPLSLPVVSSALATCLLIFLSNIPIAIAPELLSPYFRERIKLKLHVDAVKKIKKQRD